MSAKPKTSKASNQLFSQESRQRKTKALVSNIAKIDVTVTHTETEALILEHNYIKQYLPKYNVLLRDDKSYPYIFLSAHKHPRLSSHRGAKNAVVNISGLIRIRVQCVKLCI